MIANVESTNEVKIFMNLVNDNKFNQSDNETVRNQMKYLYICTYICI